MGSNMASEIGSMRITEQIDAMDMMGVNSAGFLVLQKYSLARAACSDNHVAFSRLVLYIDIFEYRNAVKAFI